jgi:C4-type Zn-finger protein
MRFATSSLKSGNFYKEYRQMTRDERLSILLADDLVNSYIKYKKMTKEELSDELAQRWDRIASSNFVLPMAHKLNGEPINL